MPLDLTSTPEEWLRPSWGPDQEGPLSLADGEQPPSPPSRIAETPESQIPDDPAARDYLRRLVEGILGGRTLVATYNLVLLAVLLVLAVLHWRETRHDRRRWRTRLKGGSATEKGTPALDATSEAGSSARTGLRGGGMRTSTSSSSSSSSTLEGTSTPPDAYKDVDIERRPLLGRRPHPRQHRPGSAVLRRLRAWLAYQPAPIPVVHRTLPSNGTTLFVLAWLGLNLFYQARGVPPEGRFLFLFADRAGLVFAANLPLLYLLAAKNQPLRRLTGRSYESLNILHRRVGELLCLEAALHLAGMLAFRVLYEPDWLRRGATLAQYLHHPLVLLGLGAFASYELLFLASLASVRRRWYELFLASHVALQGLGLVFLWLHFATARPYVLAALLIFAADRLVWRAGLKSATADASVTLLEDGETLLLSMVWDMPGTATGGGASLLRPGRSVLHGWRPGDHVFLTVPALGRTHALQAHPFTIASAAPPARSPSSASPPPQPTRARLDLLVRRHAGFTADLVAHARLAPACRLGVRLDGPYGSSRALALLRASDTAVLVAGGSGIAVAYPLAAALLLRCDGRPAARRPRVRLLWVTRDPSHRAWVPAGRLEALALAGAELVTPPATRGPGGARRRPDVAGPVGVWADEAAARGGSVGVVVSGPDGMNRAVRNVCAAALGRGADVRVAVEKFGW